jgi:hypothetical protein
MSLSTRDAKKYLASTPVWNGVCTRAHKQRAAELEALSNPHGLPCQRDLDRGPGEAVLRFDAATDRWQVETLLESYQMAKGS